MSRPTVQASQVAATARVQDSQTRASSKTAVGSSSLSSYSNRNPSLRRNSWRPAIPRRAPSRRAPNSSRAIHASDNDHSDSSFTSSLDSSLSHTTDSSLVSSVEERPKTITRPQRGQFRFQVAVVRRDGESKQSLPGSSTKPTLMGGSKRQTDEKSVKTMAPPRQKPLPKDEFWTRFVPGLSPCPLTIVDDQQSLQLSSLIVENRTLLAAIATLDKRLTSEGLKNEQLSLRIQCILCKTKPRNTLLRCMHCVVCESCYETLEKCPLIGCQVPIVKEVAPMPVNFE